MYLERVTLTNFRCFGPESQTIELSAGLAAFVGANGSGKTAVMQALLRLFGITNDQRRVRRQDFHVPRDEEAPPVQRTLCIEAILDFPELADDDGAAGAVPEFFQQMAADEGGRLKCRLRLDATWTDDGSLEGAVDQKYRAVRTLAPAFNENECSDILPTDRGRIQMVYVPAVRDAASQVTAFLRGRLWRAVTWSDQIKTALADVGQELNDTFGDEPAVDLISAALTKRWQEVHSGGTDTTPKLRPIDLRFQQFIRKVEVTFHPDEAGRERSLEDLSDGQRSLFHIAMTAAALDVEAAIVSGRGGAGFQPGAVALPALTILAIEEPENNLAPFYLSRIIRQIEQITQSARAQALVSSHSASILARVDPSQVRHFRLDAATRTARIRGIRLPAEPEDAAKFVREAVRTYPELYFARFVVLGEGASEEVVIPRIAEAMGVPIDRSFVAVVPLGGRHVNHLWRLLTDLDIPYATLLDLDVGRSGGGWGRIKTACQQLLANGVPAAELFSAALLLDGGVDGLFARMGGWAYDEATMETWTDLLAGRGIFFCAPLDLDMSMLLGFAGEYRQLEAGMAGPSQQGDAKTAVLGPDGDPAVYGPDDDDDLRWYRYLFLGRGKPSTHVRVLGKITDLDLALAAPPELIALIEHIRREIFGDEAA